MPLLLLNITRNSSGAGNRLAASDRLDSTVHTRVVTRARNDESSRKRDPGSSQLTLAISLLLVLFSISILNGQQLTPDQQAEMVLSSARRAYNEKNYGFAATRFREFLAKFGNHKDAPSARYGLALALFETQPPDGQGALEQLQPLAGNKGFADHPFVLYYLASAHRGLGIKELEQAKPADATQKRALAQKHFEEAAQQFAAATQAFTSRVKEFKPDAKELPKDFEWSARARCDQAEMLLRTSKPKEAQALTAPFVGVRNASDDSRLIKSRYRNLGLYYHGYASFLLKDYLAAGRSLNMLAPFSDPAFGTHARFLLARVHHESEELNEAARHYEGVLTDYEASKKQARSEERRVGKECRSRWSPYH